MSNTRSTSHNHYDLLLLRELKVETIIGVFDWEREVTQQLNFDVELAIDMSAAARSDDVNDALSYVDVADFITKFTQSKKAKLLEHLADALADALFETWPINSIRLRITKPTAVAHAQVGIEIFRDQRGETNPN